MSIFNQLSAGNDFDKQRPGALLPSLAPENKEPEPAPVSPAPQWNVAPDVQERYDTTWNGKVPDDPSRYMYYLPEQYSGDLPFNGLVIKPEEVDHLTLQYPAYREKIMTVRSMGGTDEEIATLMSEREAELLYKYSPSIVNNMMGRNKDTMAFMQAQTQVVERSALITAYKDKYAAEEIDDRIAAGKAIGVPAKILLADEKLYKQLTGHIKMSEGYLETLEGARKSETIGRQISDLALKMMFDGETPEMQKRLKQMQEELHQYEAPLRQSLGQRVTRSTVSLGTQTVGHWTYAMNNPLMLGYVGARTAYGAYSGSAAAGVGAIPGALAGFVSASAQAVAAAAAWRTFKGYTGSSYLEYRELGMEPEVARGAAVVAGLLTSGVEYVSFKRLMKWIPGADKFLSPHEAISEMVKIPSGRAALVNIGKQFMKDVHRNATGNMLQEVAVMTMKEIGAAYQGIDSGFDMDDALKRTAGAYIVMVEGAPLMVPGLVYRGQKAYRQAEAIHKGAENLAGTIGTDVQGLEMLLNKDFSDVVQPEQAPVAAQPTQGESTASQADTHGEAAEPASQNVGAQTEAAAQAEPAPSQHLYIPGEALEVYTQENPGMLEALGIVPEAVAETGEIRLTREQFEKLSPEFRESVKLDTREGANGTTAREGYENIKNRTSVALGGLMADTPRAAEARSLATQLEEKAVTAGRGKLEARTFSRVAASVALRLSETTGIPVGDLAKIDMRSVAYADWAGRQEAAAQTYDQAAMYKNPANTIDEFRQSVLSEKSGKSVFSFTDNEGTSVEIASDDLLHVDLEHKLTGEQWQAIMVGIDNIESASFVETNKGKYDGQVAAAKLDTPLGKAGVVLEMTKNGRVFLKSAFFSTDDNLNKWLQQERKGRTPRALETDNSGTAFSTGRPLTVQSIQRELGVVNSAQEGLSGTGAKSVRDALFQSGWQTKLAADETSFARAVDALLDGTLGKRKTVNVMTTPLALGLVGADILPLVARPGVIAKIQDKHGLSAEQIKQLPRALADPVMIFDSATTPGSVVVMVDLKDSAGATVVVPIRLDKQQIHYTVNELTSAYGRRNIETNMANDKWFVRQIKDGRLRYIDSKKSSEWLESAGLYLPGELTIQSLSESIPNERDLAKARLENQVYYQSGVKNDSAAWVGDTEKSTVVPLERLRLTEEVMPESVAQAKKNMDEAKEGRREKRAPLSVVDRGDGTYSVLDGNNTLTALRELGATGVAVEVKKPFHKGVTDIASLYAQAEQSQAAFRSLMADIQAAVGGELLMRDGLKGKDRVAEKAQGDYQGNYARVTDMLAGSLVFDSEESIVSALEALRDDPRVIRIKDKWSNPDETGYRDVNLNIVLENGHVAELQLHHRGIMEAKNGLGHLLYEFIRANKYVKTVEAEAAVEQVKQLSRIIYEAGLDGRLQTMDASLMASSLEIARRLSSQTSTRGESLGILLNDLSGIILNTLPPSASDSMMLGNSSENSTANGTSSPFSKYLNANELTSSMDNITPGQVNVKGDGRDSLNQNTQSRPNAVIEFLPSWGAVVNFFETANRSTSFHELGHHILRLMADMRGMEGLDASFAADIDTTLREMGVTLADFMNDGEKRDAAQERFARTFEAYLADGKAPSKELRGAFARIRKWLIDIYRDVTQALGVEVSEEMRGVFDRLLATPEEITAEYAARTKVGELAAEHAALKERIAFLEKQIRAADPGMAPPNEAKEAVAALRKKQKERTELRAEIGKLVRGMEKMADSENIRYGAMQEIQNLLKEYDLNRRRKSTLERRAEMEAYLAEHPDDAGAINPQDLKYLGTKTLNDMSVEDVRDLHKRAKEIHERGRRDYMEWEAANRERRDKIRNAVFEQLTQKEARTKAVKTGKKDLGRDYSGIKGAAERLKEWNYAATLDLNRFYDWLDGGAGKFNGPLVEFFVDEWNRNMNERDRNIFRRKDEMATNLKELGFKITDFRKVVAEAAGRKWTKNEVMHLYIAMRNEKNLAALLHGNLGDERVGDPMSLVAFLVSKLTPEEKRAAELVVSDFDSNFGRINERLIETTNRGMEKEENYVPMKRLEHRSETGDLIDANTVAAAEHAADIAGVLRKIDEGFMQKRMDIDDDAQTPIQLGLFETWNAQMAHQEHASAFAGYSRDVAAVLMSRNPMNSRETMGRAIKERFGDTAWTTVISNANLMMRDRITQANDIFSNVASKYTQRAAVVWLAYNLGTVAKQSTSFPLFLPHAGPAALTAALAEFTANPNAFLEKAYALDPQLRARAGDATIQMLRGEMKPWLNPAFDMIGFVDKCTASIGFMATYEANLSRGLSSEKAVVAAQRAVHLTQMATHAKDKPLLWRQSGLIRTAMLFTGDAAKYWNISTYDLVQALRSPTKDNIKTAFYTALGLTLYAMMTKTIEQGWPDDEDGEGWDEWFASALTDQSIKSVPLIGGELLPVWERYTKGKRSGTQYSAFVDPIFKMSEVMRIMGDENRTAEDERRAMYYGMEILGLGTGAPIPATGIKKLIESGVMLSDDEPMAAALYMMGRRQKRQR